MHDIQEAVFIFLQTHTLNSVFLPRGAMGISRVWNVFLPWSEFREPSHRGISAAPSESSYGFCLKRQDQDLACEVCSWMSKALASAMTPAASCRPTSGSHPRQVAHSHTLHPARQRLDWWRAWTHEGKQTGQAPGCLMQKWHYLSRPNHHDYSQSQVTTQE